MLEKMIQKKIFLAIFMMSGNMKGCMRENCQKHGYKNKGNYGRGRTLTFNRGQKPFIWENVGTDCIDMAFDFIYKAKKGEKISSNTIVIYDFLYYQFSCEHTKPKRVGGMEKKSYMSANKNQGQLMWIKSNKKSFLWLPINSFSSARIQCFGL